MRPAAITKFTRKAALPFFLFVFWDWVSTAGVIYVSHRDASAVPIAMLTTTLWLWGTRYSLKTNPLVIIAAAALGTWLGLLWP